MPLILEVLSNLINIYFLFLLLRITLTWFPNVNWYVQPFYSLTRLTTPYLVLFRGIIPMFGSMDLSPLLGFLFLDVLGRLVQSLK